MSWQPRHSHSAPLPDCEKIELQFSSPRAPLRARPDNARAHCFLVYFDGGTASTAALNSALDLREPDTRIIVVACTVAPPRASAPDSRHGAEALLAAAVREATQRGVPVSTETLECDDLGHALVECTARFQADIIFWGVERSEVETGLGAAAAYVLKFASAKVVLVGI